MLLFFTIITNNRKNRKRVLLKLASKIASKIKILRKTRGYTQQQLADMLGVQRATISNYEIGRRSPHIKELARLAEILGVNLEYFGVSNDELTDFIAKARVIFDDDEIPLEDKAKVYKEVLKLYLNLDDK